MNGARKNHTEGGKPAQKDKYVMYLLICGC